MKQYLILALLLLSIPGAAQTTQRIVEVPSGEGPFPVLLVAPAKKYSMKEHLFQRLADEALDQGYIVVRFDWNFFTQGKEPSDGLEAEANQLDEQIEFARSHPQSSGKVVLAAKSFGSVVAVRRAWRSVEGVLLWTPNSNKDLLFEDVYGPLLKSSTPTHIVISTTDPYGELSQLYDYLTNTSAAVTVHTLFGDHNFQTDPPDDGLNEDAAFAGSVNWLRRYRPEAP